MMKTLGRAVLFGAFVAFLFFAFDSWLPWAKVEGFRYYWNVMACSGLGYWVGFRDANHASLGARA